MEKLVEFIIYVIVFPLLCVAGGMALIYLLLLPFAN